MTGWDDIAAAIGSATQTRFVPARTTPIAGGDINRAVCVEGTDGRRYFVKLNDAHRAAMFDAECAGLEALAATRTVRVPQAIVSGTSGNDAFLVLEYLSLEGSGRAHALGEQLAVMHHASAERFGFAMDNTIGATPQPNTWRADWIAFWRECRLGFQLQLAARNGHNGKLQDLGHDLLERLPAFFSGYLPQPALLHGDLWGGNHAYLADGTPVIFDPAVYFGDREADLAMTELFGGFDQAFHAGYRAAWPLDQGYGARKGLYNLYHVLNHANLFGGGYVRQAESMMQRLLADLR